ncbi:MAG: hypothetical protein ACYC4J_00790 [Gemmatimonadaceae bacterium]
MAGGTTAGAADRCEAGIGIGIGVWLGAIGMSIWPWSIGTLARAADLAGWAGMGIDA